MTLDPTRFSIVRKSNRRIVAEVRVGYDIPSNLCVAFDVAVDTGTTLEIHGNQTTVVVTPTSMTFRHGPWREYLDLSTVSGDPISLVQGAFFSVLKESPATSLNYRLREERSRELLTQHLGRFGLAPGQWLVADTETEKPNSNGNGNKMKTTNASSLVLASLLGRTLTSWWCVPVSRVWNWSP